MNNAASERYVAKCYCLVLPTLAVSLYLQLAQQYVA